ncbi:class I SAM-dependent methyltransferase [Nocardia sp. NPDC058658]|uniref:class I SAM-dependent methyltransferase n=1 Tax=Nocardia sp. NPDC058658 TaxID=3346580 RepID=UPI003664CE55
MPLSPLRKLNQRHPWSHNDHYGRWVADRVAAAGARNALDVGCGTGNLIARLRDNAVTVTGFEPDPTTCAVAADRFADDLAVTICRTDFSGRDPHQRWDAITLVAVLHHMPLLSTLRELRDSLTPGGRLVIVGCYRAASPADFLATLPAVVANPVMGMIKHPTRATSTPLHMTAPTTDPTETLAEIRAAAAAELPGSRIRRRLFWRYTLIFDKPSGLS